MHTLKPTHALLKQKHWEVKEEWLYCFLKRVAHLGCRTTGRSEATNRYVYVYGVRLACLLYTSDAADD